MNVRNSNFSLPPDSATAGISLPAGTSHVQAESGQAPTTETGLIHFDTAYRSLALASTIDEAREIRNTAAALQVYAKQAGLSLEMQNKAAEIKLRAERRCGELLGEMAERGERDAGQGGDRRSQSQPATVKLDDLAIGKDQSSRWQKIAAIPAPTFERYIADKRDSGQEITTAALLARRDASPTLSSDSYEWYTPALYVEAARRVLGEIDLDPASSELANGVVGASQYFTRDDDGLAQEWHGRVWLNPPYGGAQAAFTDHLLAEYQRGHVTAAVLLVNAHATDTDWFQPLWDHILCFTNHRINFISPSGEAEGGSTHGNVFIYLGEDWPAFAREFADFGAVVSRYRISA